MKVISHYRIVRELGAGGMGEVYLAEDARLGRNVAIKVLPSHLTRDHERLRRFEREARAASALNHPNIVTIYDVGQSGDEPFIVTEFIEGETLRERMARTRTSVRDALQVSIQVADAIAAAHQAGIIHRDIKPENIMLRRDGYVKVVDFGLAKLTEEHPGRTNNEAPTMPGMETEPGRVMGTVSYMSPEQARGVGVDATTDIFSLGVVIYEMLAGRRPFDGETKTDVILAILKSEPPSLSSLAPGVPPELERIVARALAKPPRERYQSAAELSAELKSLRQSLEVEVETALRSDAVRVSSGARPAGSFARWRRFGLAAIAALAVAGAAALLLGRGAKSSDAIDSLAVLPFENAGGDPNAEYLSDGITESLINSLSQLPGIKVMSRSAVWRYKTAGHAAPPDARVVGKELSVRAVLTGRVVRQRDRLSISVELVDARDDSQLWGERWDRSSSDLLAVQEEIASRATEKLRLKLTGDDRRLLAKRHTENTDAYERYIRGRYYLNKRSADAIRKGRDFFQQAIDEDPAYALAYSGVSDSYALLTAQAAMAPDEAYPAALAAARKAIELDPGLAEGHASLAHAALHTGDLATAEREFARAIELRPNYVPAYLWQSEFFEEEGRHDEAYAATRKALALDPLDLAANAQLAALFMREREYDKAIAQLEKTLEIDPNYFLAHVQLGQVYLRTDRFPEAIAEFAEAARLTGGSRGLGGLGIAYVRSGQPGKAEEVAREMESRAASHYTDPIEVARVYAALKEKDSTLRWLTRAVDENPRTIERTRDADEFAFVRSDPRYAALARRAK
jgi:serine/threonine protein kinase/cytochrome c-type biogenesis protein CcmH/NrfG